MKIMFATMLAFLSLQPVYAEELLDSYIAKLGLQDHFNSKGERLMDAAAIIRQDRANYHKFGKSDKEDEYDSFFDSKKNRAALENMLRNGDASQKTLNEIINGTPYIAVFIYEDKIRVIVQ